MFLQCFQGDEIWISSSDEENSEEECGDHSSSSNPVWTLVFFLVLWQAVYRVSNAAITSILSFFRYFTLFVGNAFRCEGMKKMAGEIPLSYPKAQKLLGMKNAFTEYVVCPRCDSIYVYEDCVKNTSGRIEGKLCEHIAFPSHPQHSRRQPCNSPLLKKVRRSKGYSLKPIRVYPYYPLRMSLEYLASRPGFLDICEEWRHRASCVPESFLGDIYDGSVWKDFNSADSLNFLTSPYCYLVTLNIDWFQPFTHSIYSVGGIYLTIQNLPRSQRFREENCILVGLIPGPKEPKMNINSYLSPLVEELKAAWETGFQVSSPHRNVSVTIRLALSCVACDIPATRKVCGFLGHNASLGCNKCLKRFSINFGGASDYSGCDREEWQLRNAELHRQHCQEVLRETTKSGICAVESRYGVRYSILLNLPYYDPIRFVAIDTMHNLFLGTGKMIFKLWLERGFLSHQQVAIIEERVQSFNVPPELGRLPSNILSNYGGFTANQWQNWITIFSSVALKGLLQPELFQNWLMFVRACCILSRYILTIREVESADLYLLNFCKSFQQLYGSESFTPNLHLHLHLKQCVIDFGPSHCFWCFPFERYNGLLGSYSTNKKAIEVQVMRKFLSSRNAHGLLHRVDPDVLPILPLSVCKNKSLSEVCTDDESVVSLLTMSHAPLNTITSFHNRGEVCLLPPLRQGIFSSEESKHLLSIYLQLYPDMTIPSLSLFYTLCNRVTLGGECLGSLKSRSHKSAVVMAYWPGRGGNLSDIDYSKRMRVGVVNHYIRHQITLQGEQQEHVFACVSWKIRHPYEDWFGVSATVCCNIFEESGPCMYLPVQRINCRCASALLSVEIGSITEPVFVACPIPIKYAL